jgi:hypothetical protein
MKLNFDNLTPRSFLEYYLTLISSLRPVSQRLNPNELALLIEFALLPQKFASYPFSSAGKKKVASTLKLKSQLLHQRIYSLIRKGFLRRDEDKVILFPSFIKKVLSQMLATNQTTLTLSFTLDNEKDFSAYRADFPTY